MKLKIATLGFVLATFGLGFLCFVALFAWAMADFDCAGSYWQCHGPVARELVLFLGIPVLGWVICAVLIIRAWKKSDVL